MYVHRRCKPSEAELDMDKTVHGYCEICKNQGTIYLVKGTEDSYRHKRQGVTYFVTAVNATDALVFDEIAPVDTGPEVELPEESEAIVGTVSEALEAEIEDAVPEEKEPEKTPAEAEPEPSAELTQEGYEEFVGELHEETIAEADAKEPLEAVSEPLIEAESENTFEENEEILTPGIYDDEHEKIPPEGEGVVEFAERYGIPAEAEKARKAKIARLEAELEELQK